MDDNTIYLLRRWHGGDRQALDSLIHRHLEWVKGYVHRRLGNDLRRGGDTQDFVQDAMVQVLEYGPRFELADEDHFRRLLARIVENSLRVKHRHLHRQKRDIGREKEIGSGTVLSLDPPRDQATRPSAHADQNERIAWIRLAMELLPPLEREVLWLREMDGCSFEEIGERIGATPDAARMRFNRALPKLAKKVSELQKGRIATLLDEAEV
ncbi:MAG: sigma-70 family RNA polymerase sigma factor [Planctomycetes bacterium]|nr:sigma-70 family RNA polymerase sigma factor [Planctomycetota bacterium]MCB9870627.1 sigma-70 family RNA polymerase sigma factor [Planctomycetota bacterium]